VPQLPLQFMPAFESINCDLGLFLVVAEKAVSEFQLTADRLDALIAASNLPDVARAAHKLCSVWAMYAKAGEEGLAAQVETYANAGQKQMALTIARELVTALRDAAQSLQIWLGRVQGEN
jgi:hypothetical protein